ncbi:SwmB domain-containing protein [Orenia marismortui]|uniref:Putative repeat protein (TIGR02059 family) n=1 Tax=Orenia marismortui TaxID=46469 RepID=A0A4R8HG43_9FIRM|nr:SwmB domain-containing protein [Orenia marismortui]TDX58992.1 putative repeat protein (TIGR02059 family) [Orenia marismortui]
MGSFFSQKNNKLLVISVLMIGLLALVGCSDDDGSPTYNVSGKVIKADGTGVEGIKLNAGNKVAETDAEGKWSFTRVKEGVEITPVAGEAQSATFFEPEAYEVKSNQEDVEFTMTGVTGATYVEGIEYKEDIDETLFIISFDRDIREADARKDLKEAITVEGLDGGFSVNLLANEEAATFLDSLNVTNTDDGDDDTDYLEDKVLIIRINGRVANELKVIIEKDTFVNYDEDGEKGSKLGAIETAKLGLSADNSLETIQEAMEGDGVEEITTVVSDIDNKAKTVYVLLNDDKLPAVELPTVEQVYSSLSPVDAGAEVISISEREDNTSLYRVNENDLVVVRAENGKTTEYKIEIDPMYKDNTVESRVNVDGNKYYTVDNTANVISSGTVTISYNGKFDISKLDYDNDYKDVMFVEKDYDDEFSADKADDIKDLVPGNEYKLVVRSAIGTVRIYDIETAEPSDNTNLISDDIRELAIDNEAKTVVVNTNAAGVAFDTVFAPEDNAILPSEAIVDDATVTITAADGITTADYKVDVVPAITDAVIDDDVANEINLTFSEEVGLSDKSGFTVKVNDTEIAIKSMHNNSEGNGEEYATLVLAEDVKELQTVTISYDGSGDINADADNDPLFAHVNYPVTNNVDAPDFADAIVRDNNPYSLEIEFDMDLDPLVDEDYEDIDASDNFTVMVNGTEVEIKAVTRDDIDTSSSGQDTITLTLVQKILEDDDITVSYTPLEEYEFIRDIAEDQTVGFENQGVANAVNAPDYEMIPVAVTDNRNDMSLIDDTITADQDAVLVELDSNVTIDGDANKVAEQFTVYLNDKAYIPSDIDVSTDGTLIQLTIDTRILEGEKIEVAYTPGNNVYNDQDVLEDGYNNVARSFAAGSGDFSTKGKSVPNRIEVPELETATIFDGAADKLVLDFNANVELYNVIAADPNAFTVNSSQGEINVIDVTAGTDADQIVLTLEEAVDENAKINDITVTYDPQFRSDSPVTTDLIVDSTADDLYNRVLPFIDEVVDNRVKVPTELINAIVIEGDRNQPDTIELTFNDDIEEVSKIVNDAEENIFYVNYSGGVRDSKDPEEITVTNATVSGDKVILTLDDYVAGEDEFTLHYIENVIKDVDGDTVVDFDGIGFASDATSTIDLDNGDNIGLNEVEELYITGGKATNPHTILLDLNKVIAIDQDDPDFDFDASYGDDFADDNFKVYFGSQEVKVTNTQLKATGTLEEQILLTLNKPITVDSGNVTVSYEFVAGADQDHIDSKITDGRHNYLENDNLDSNKINKNVPIESLDFASFESAIVEDNTSNIISLTFTDSVINTPAVDSIDVTVGGSSATISNVRASGNNVSITLDEKVKEDALVQVSGIFEFVANDVELSNEAVVNEVEGAKVASALVADNVSDKVVVTFEEKTNIDDATGNDTSVQRVSGVSDEDLISDFKVAIDGNNTTITAVNISANKLTLTLDRKVEETASVTLDYTNNDHLQDQYGNLAVIDASVAAFAVANEVENDLAIDYDSETTLANDTANDSAVVTVPMNQAIEYQGNSDDINSLDLKVYTVNDGTALPINTIEVVDSGRTLKITLANAVTKEDGNLTAYYISNPDDNLVTIAKDAVETFSVHVQNTLTEE